MPGSGGGGCPDSFWGGKLGLTAPLPSFLHLLLPIQLRAISMPNDSKSQIPGKLAKAIP